MPDPTLDPDLDAELRHIARALVAETPDEIPPFDDLADLAVPLVRPQDGVAPPTPLHRRPRVVLIAAAAVVALLAGVAGAVGRGGPADDGDPEPVSLIAADAGLEAAPQRLLLDGAYELRPDGSVVRVETAGLDAHGRLRWLPDGRLVVVGVHATDELPEGVESEFDLPVTLAVLGTDGTVDIEREVEPSSLLGVTETEAILRRGPDDVVAHDLATGDERLVGHTPAGDPTDSVWQQPALVGGDLIVAESRQETEPYGDDGARMVPGTERCTLQRTDIYSGEREEHPIDLPCSAVIGLQVSPDGHRAALAYESPFTDIDLPPEQRLALIDLADATVLHDQLLGHNVQCDPGGTCPGVDDQYGYRGMAWSTGTSVQVALEDLTSPGTADPTLRTIVLP